MPRQSKYNKEEKDNVKSYQYKAAIYIRLSVEDGDKEESNSITNQRMLLNQFLKDNSDIEVYDYYTDDGFSGTTFNRPGFEKLLEDLYEKKFNTVIVKDLSRLGRNYIAWLEIVRLMAAVRFYCLPVRMDTDGVLKMC